MDGTLATDGTSVHVVINLMDGLTAFDKDLNPIPAIAKIELRPNKRYYAGRPHFDKVELFMIGEATSRPCIIIM